MPDSIMNTILDLNHVTAGPVLICLLSALGMGLLAGLYYWRCARCSRSLVTALVLLPLVSAAVILAVNGNLGAGIAVAGAFSLVRFRSAQGSAHEILAVFLSMCLGLCCGAGYVAIAAIVLVIALAAELLLKVTKFGAETGSERTLKVTVPEAQIGRAHV